VSQSCWHGGRALTALRGVKLTAAITLLAELDDISRFESPSQLMGYVGLVPSESSSGAKRRQGGLTKAGNPHARRMLFECAWAYRFPARKTGPIQRRAEKTPPAVQAIAWKAQTRLCGRFRRLQRRGLIPTKTVTAVARELCGFIWAVVCEVQRPDRLPAAA
jgi:transposase